MYQYVEEEDKITYTGSFSETLPDNASIHTISLLPRQPDINLITNDTSDKSKTKKNSRAKKISPNEKRRLEKISRSKLDSFKKQKKRDRRGKEHIREEPPAEVVDSSKAEQLSCSSHQAVMIDNHLPSRFSCTTNRTRFLSDSVRKMFTYGSARSYYHDDLVKTAITVESKKRCTDRWLKYYSGMSTDYEA